MLVGVLKLNFHIPHARTLNDKRSVVRKFRDRVRARHHVLVAEVAGHDLLQTAVFGVSVMSADASMCGQLVANVARAAETQEDAIRLGRVLKAPRTRRVQCRFRARRGTASAALSLERTNQRRNRRVQQVWGHALERATEIIVVGDDLWHGGDRDEVDD